MELDRQLAQFMKMLDEKVGKGQWLLFLTADHGASHNHNLLKQRHMMAGGLELWNTLKPTEAALEQELGFAPVIKKENSGWVYINEIGAAKAGKSMDKVKAAVCEKLLANDSILYAVDCEKVLTTTVPQPIREMIVNGYRKEAAVATSSLCRRQDGRTSMAPRNISVLLMLSGTRTTHIYPS